MVAQSALDFISHSPEQTRRIGWRIGQHAHAGDVLLLSGPFGAGKTLLTQGLAAGLGIAERVTSPSFTLVNEHPGQTADGRRICLYHVDLYRLETAAAVATVGLEELFADPDGICAIEWPDRLGVLAPPEFLLIELTAVTEMKRRLALTPHGDRATTWLADLRTEAFGVGP